MFKLMLLVCLLNFALSANISHDVVGGDGVSIEKHPYLASVLYKGNHICGGAVISSKHILTSAACTDMDDASLDNIQVRVGSEWMNEAGIIIGLNKIVQHPKYHENKPDYDVSILELNTEIIFYAKVQPVALPSSNDEPPGGTPAVLVGFGRQSEEGSYPARMNAVTIPVVARGICQEVMSSFPLTPRQICAGANGKDACEGDQGSPLVAKDMLVGLVSWGLGCGQPGKLRFYTNVASLRSFINEATGL